MNASENTLNWFEIPVENIDRAKKFYETVFGISMTRSNMMGMEMIFFPNDHNPGQVSGALVKSENHIPSAKGSKIYLNGNPDLAIPLSKVVEANGKVLMSKTLIDEQTGYMAFISDTEGNTIGLHSDKQTIKRIFHSIRELKKPFHKLKFSALTQCHHV